MNHVKNQIDNFLKLSGFNLMTFGFIGFSAGVIVSYFHFLQIVANLVIFISVIVFFYRIY